MEMMNDNNIGDGINANKLTVQQQQIDEIAKQMRTIYVNEDYKQQQQQHRHQQHRSSFCIDDIRKHNYFDDIGSNGSGELDDLNHLFHINFMQSLQLMNARDKRFKNGTRLSCTFTNEQMRQIERENRILLNKILAQRPNSGARRTMTTTHERARASSASRISSAAINRRQQQERIDFVNNILRKKIEKIALRNPKQ